MGGSMPPMGYPNAGVYPGMAPTRYGPPVLDPLDYERFI